MLTLLLVMSLPGQIIYGQASQAASDQLIDRRIEQSYGVNNPRPKVISFVRGPQDWPGYNGVVTKIQGNLIYTDLAVESVAFRFGPTTRFRTLSGRFKRLAPGDQINVDAGIVTIVD